jgi:hypothetical protein
MEPCADCKALNRQLSSRAPHGNLVFQSSKPKGYPTPGSDETWTCKVCGASFSRDLDRRDDQAKWEIDLPRNS